MRRTREQLLKQWALLLLGSMGFFARVAAGSLEQPDVDFRFRDKSIHPLLVKQFEPWISDARPPITVEVNVTAAWDSNEYAAESKTDSSGVVFVKLSDGATYSYQHLGRLRNGLHVLRTAESGGGSGVFEALLFVRFRTAVAYLADGVRRDRQVFMQLVRRYPLGDRDGAEIVIQRDQVIVGKSRYRETPVVLKFEKTARGLKN